MPRDEDTQLWADMVKSIVNETTNNYCDGGCGSTNIWVRSDNNMCRECETKKIDKEYEDECADMRRRGYERDEFGEWEKAENVEIKPKNVLEEPYIKLLMENEKLKTEVLDLNIQVKNLCGECYLCEDTFVKYCDEWGATNMIGDKGEIHPIEFCYDCWANECENSVENEELGYMVWSNKDDTDDEACWWVKGKGGDKCWGNDCGCMTKY